MAPLAMGWLISFARARTEKTMAERLAAELILACTGEGNTIKKKEDTHRPPPLVGDLRNEDVAFPIGAREVEALAVGGPVFAAPDLGTWHS